MLGQLSAGRRIGGKAACLSKDVSCLRHYGTGCDEKMKAMFYRVRVLCLSFALTDVLGAIFSGC